MRCAICKQAELEIGTTTITLERDNLTMLIKSVPARVCPNCGEAYVDRKVTADLLRTAEDMAQMGAQVDIRQYMPA